MKIRVKFGKHGTMKFVGHLDIMRYFQKAIRRAKIDIAYSTGFSPHQIMSFAAPLGVGLESNGEYFDIECESVTTAKDFIDALNAQMVEGMEILDAKQLPEKAGNAMASVAAATYRIAFRDGMEPEFDYRNAIEAFIGQSNILVTKKTKKSEMEIDLKPLIYDMKLADNQNDILMTVDASSSGNIKPGLVLKALFEQNHTTLNEYAIQVTREDTLTNIGTAEKKNFVPLIAVGVDFS